MLDFPISDASVIMKWDRLIVFVIAAGCASAANLVLNTFPQAEYGYGFPLKWTFDPVYKASDADDTPPYLRKLTPRELWPVDRTALLIDILLALAAVGVALGVNELVQTSAGNRSPAIPPNA